VGERSAGSAGEHGGHEAAVAGEELRGRERVDAAVDAVQAPGRRPPLDGAVAQTEGVELGKRQNALLAGPKGRDRPVEVMMGV